MAREGRSIAGWLWRNFISSITTKSRKENIIGKDHFGTTYYEIPADPQSGKRRPARWFQATEKEKFDQEIPTEWEAWLRGRRSEPPTQEEIDANNALSQLKKIRAKELEDKRFSERSKSETVVHHSSEPKSPFPKYDNYDDPNLKQHQKS